MTELSLSRCEKEGADQGVGDKESPGEGDPGKWGSHEPRLRVKELFIITCCKESQELRTELKNIQGGGQEEGTGLCPHQDQLQ